MTSSNPQKPKFASDGKLSAVNRTLSPSETSRQSIAPGISAALASGFAEEPLPAQFGRYRILKFLGGGNMGQVYLAEDTQLKRTVALKVPWTATLKHPDALARFYREARTAATLQHPNICAMYDVGEIEGRHYLTMAYIPGKPLSHFLDNGKLQPFREVALLFRKLARALHEAHQQGVVHRDLKPANVMLDDRKEPVVMDFGLAHLLNSDEQARLTQTGAILGTPAYMSPEQVRGDRDAIGPASDVYALGVMLYQFLTGELPFVGTVYSVFGQILTQDPPRPSEIRPDVDATLESICLKMMARDSDDRYASMFEVGRDLTAYLKGQSVEIVLSVWDELPVLPVKLPASPKKLQETVDLPAVSAAAPRMSRLAVAVLLAVMGIMLVVLAIKPLIPTFGEATVLIQVEDPELSVEFAGRTILSIHSEQAFQVVADRAYALDVVQDGKVVMSEKFIWKNDAKATLVITRINGPITIIPRELLMVLRAAEVRTELNQLNVTSQAVPTSSSSVSPTQPVPAMAPIQPEPAMAPTFASGAPNSNLATPLTQDEMPAPANSGYSPQGIGVARNPALPAPLETLSNTDSLPTVATRYLGKRQFVRTHHFASNKPFAGNNRPYEESGILSIRGANCASAWNFVDVTGGQLLRTRLRVRGDRAAKVGLSLTQRPRSGSTSKRDPYGLMIWISGDQELHLEPGWFGERKDIVTPRRIRLDEVLEPVNEWNDVAIGIRTQTIDVFVNNQLIHTVDTVAFPFSYTTVALAINSGTIEATVECDDYSVWQIR